jgi:hypothetical protein
MDKKAQGLSMNVIIIAAIALLVLIILAVLVLRAGRGITEGTGCTGIGGQCADDCGAIEGGTYIQNLPNSGKAGNCAEGQVCCVPLIKQAEE